MVGLFLFTCTKIVRTACKCISYTAKPASWLLNLQRNAFLKGYTKAHTFTEETEQSLPLPSPIHRSSRLCPSEPLPGLQTDAACAASASMFLRRRCKIPSQLSFRKIPIHSAVYAFIADRADIASAPGFVFLENLGKLLPERLFYGGEYALGEAGIL